MKKLISFVSLLFAFLSCTCAYAQQPFNNCTAAVLDGIMIVDEYTDTGKCVLDSTAKGTLTVCTMELYSEKSKCKPTGSVPFMVGIRDGRTHTIMMYSNQVYRRLDIRQVLKKCHKGDSIIVMTMSNEYAVPHNEILIQ